MQLTTHLMFDGQCEEAFRFYAKTLGGEIVTMMTYGDSPMAVAVPPEWQGKIIHASLAIDGKQMLAGGDAMPGGYQAPQGVSVAIPVSTVEEAERLYAVMAEGATVITMPLQETFWAQRFGMFTDRFGIPWMINCGKPV